MSDRLGDNSNEEGGLRGSPRLPRGKADAEAGPLACAILFLIPCLAAAGPFLPVIPLPGLNLFAFRLAVLASLLVPVLLTARLTWFRYAPTQIYFLVGVLWSIWGLASAFWAENKLAALSGAMVIFSGFLVALALVNLLGYTDRGLKWLVRGWVMAGILSMMLAIWELATGNHLPGAWIDSQPFYVQRLIAVATFHNPNNLAAFLLLLSSIIITKYMFVKNHYLKNTVLFLYMTLILLIIFLTGSRISAVGLIMMIIIYIVIENKNRRYAVFLTTLIVALIIPLYVQYSDQLPRVDSIIKVFERGVSNDSSGSIRLNLTLAGFDMLASSGGLGIGAGNFQSLMIGGYKNFPTGGIIDPHNWWIEVLSEYGIVSFLLYFFIWIYLLYIMALYGSTNIKKIIILSYAFFVASFANSSYGAQSTNWLFHATLLMFVLNVVHTEKRRGEASGRTMS